MCLEDFPDLSIDHDVLIEIRLLSLTEFSFKLSENNLFLAFGSF